MIWYDTIACLYSIVFYILYAVHLQLIFQIWIGANGAEVDQNFLQACWWLFLRLVARVPMEPQLFVQNVMNVDLQKNIQT